MKMIWNNVLCMCIEHITYCSEETLVFNSRLTAVTSGRLFCNCRSQNGQEEFPTAPLYKKFSGRLLWRSCLRISIRLRSYPLQKIDRLLLNPFSFLVASADLCWASVAGQVALHSHAECLMNWGIHFSFDDTLSSCQGSWCRKASLSYVTAVCFFLHTTVFNITLVWCFVFTCNWMFCGLNAGVYKGRDARMTLQLYHMRALVKNTYSKITEETFIMDGFVSLFQKMG